MSVRIRVATHEHGHQIMEMLVLMHEESGIDPLNVEKVSHDVAAMIDHGTVLLLEDTGEILGGIALYEGVSWYSDTRYYTDRWTYILPDYRGGDLFDKLLTAARKVAEMDGLPLRLGIMSVVQAEAKARLYRRKGMTQIGALFDVNTEAGSPCASADQKPKP